MNWIVIAFIFFLAGASSCSHSVKIDTAMAAIEAGDFTVIIEGCGNQPIPGYSYCRVTEGDAANSVITIHAPPAACKQDQCVFWKVYQPDGSTDIGGGIPRGQTNVSIAWTELIHKQKFSTGDRGFWPVTLEVHYVDTDGRDRVAVAEGEIRLRVMRAGYQPLSDVRDDSNFVWTWTTGNHVMKSTTGLRSYVGLK